MKNVGWDQFQELWVDSGWFSPPGPLLKVGKLGTSKELGLLCRGLLEAILLLGHTRLAE